MGFFAVKRNKIIVLTIAGCLILGGATTGIVLGVTNSDDETETPANVDITTEMFTAPQALVGISYSGGKQELISVGQCEYGTFMYKLGEEEWNSTTPLGEFGDYTVLWYIDGKDGYNDYGSKNEPYSISVAIGKGNLRDDQIVAPTVVQNLKCTGEAQSLIHAGSLISSDFGTFMYSLDKTNWSSDVPSAINAGNYNIYWYITGSEYFKDYGSKENPLTLTNSIAKGTITSQMVTAPVAETNFGFGNLVVPGSTEAGKIMYSVRDINDEESYYWDEAAPMFDVPGTYVISWYVDGGDNYESFYDDGEKPFEFNVTTTKSALPDSYYPQGEPTSTSEQTRLGRAGTQDGSGTIINYFYSLDKVDWQKNVAFDVPEGNYVVYWYSEENANYYGVGSATNPMSYYAILTSKEIPTIGEDTFLPLGYTLMYTGEPQEICFEGELTLTGMGHFMYSLDGVNYSDEVPTVTEIGYYDLYFYLTEGITFCGLGCAEYPLVDGGEILKPYLYWEEMPKSVNTFYTGEPIELVEFEPVNVGTYYFKVGDGDYSTEIPTATEKGSYEISWYYDGEGLYENEGSAEEPADTFTSIIK